MPAPDCPPPLNPVPMLDLILLMDDGKYKYVRLVQSLKELAPMLVTVSGIVTFLRLPHALNNLSLMLVTP